MRGFQPSVLTRLGGYDPESIKKSLRIDDIDWLPVRRAPKLMVRIWRGDVAAMTLPWAIYVRASVLAGDPVRLANLLTHELVHVRQWHELGILRFLYRYLTDYWRGRRRGLGHNEAYLAIRFEVEARQLSGH
jgi:hypothetical protein